METVRPDSSGTQHAESEAQHLELLALSRVSAALSGLGNLDAILRVALDSVLDIMNGTIGGIQSCSWTNRVESYPIVYTKV
jgi:hypothetical protein